MPCWRYPKEVGAASTMTSSFLAGKIQLSSSFGSAARSAVNVNTSLIIRSREKNFVASVQGIASSGGLFSLLFVKGFVVNDVEPKIWMHRNVECHKGVIVFGSETVQDESEQINTDNIFHRSSAVT